MKKTNRKCAIIQTINGKTEWIERRIWADEKGYEMVKVNGCWFDLWMTYLPPFYEVQTWVD